MSAATHEMSEETYASCIANGADLTLEGYERRLLALRTAIRHRQEDRPQRMWCHLREYRAVYAESARKMRRIIKRLRDCTPLADAFEESAAAAHARID